MTDRELIKGKLKAFITGLTDGGFSPCVVCGELLMYSTALHRALLLKQFPEVDEGKIWEIFTNCVNDNFEIVADAVRRLKN